MRSFHLFSGQLCLSYSGFHGGRVRIAVLIPCYNEETTVAEVVRGFGDALPGAEIYVYDNGSTDGTARAARAAGAIVRRETQPGKGNVVRRMFADIEADVYVMVDGDNTYDPRCAPEMVRELVRDDLDMVVGSRLDSRGAELFRSGHRFGNRMITGVVGLFFGNRLDDVLSGYRVMSRRFVKSFPCRTSGFEIETELTIHALHLKLPIRELPCSYGSRPEGSVSKLSTYRDGVRIMQMILYLVKEIRPLLFFSTVGLCLAIVAIVLAVPVFQTYLATGLVPRFPTAILSTGLMILAFVSLVCGLVLDSVAGSRWEAKRRYYLAIPASSSAREPSCESP